MAFLPLGILYLARRVWQPPLCYTYALQVADDAMQMDVRKTFYPF